ERCAVRQGIKGECAGSTIAETVPTMARAAEWLAQAEALIYHREYGEAILATYEAAAAAARVPLYARLVDPFTSEEAIWEFENLFVLSGQTLGAWRNLSAHFDELKAGSAADESASRAILNEVREFASYCENFLATEKAMLAPTAA